MRRLLLASCLLSATASAQVTTRGKPLGTWNIEYDQTIVHMHGESTHRHDRGHITLRADGDSLFGELVIGDSATGARSMLRGKSTKDTWTVYVDEPKGANIFFSAVEAAMDWLRETVHGIQPTVIRLDLTSRGDSLTGSRTVTGGMSSSPRTSALTGTLAKP